MTRRRGGVEACPVQRDVCGDVVGLGRTDAIDGIRILERARFKGAVQLISGKDPDLVDAVRAIGERHGLKMLAPLQKPFRSEQLRRIFEGATIDVPNETAPTMSRLLPRPTTARRMARLSLFSDKSRMKD